MLFSLSPWFFQFFLFVFYIGRSFMKAIDRKCVFIFLKKDTFLNCTGLGKTHIFFITETEKNWKNRDFFHVLAPEKEKWFFRKLIASGPVPSGFNISVTGKPVFVESPWTAACSMRLFSKHFCICKEITPTGWCLKNKITSKMYALSPCSKGISLIQNHAKPTLLIRNHTKSPSETLKT